MKNVPKFLHLANNKAAEGREFILHTGRPAWLAEVFKFDTEAEIVKFGQDIMSSDLTNVIASRSRKPWNGKLYFFLVIDIFNAKLYADFEATQAETDRVARIARRMSDWYLFNVLKDDKD